MRLYGSGVLRYPGTSRTVHDFDDGPLDTYNADIIRHALAMGCTTAYHAPIVSTPEEPEPVVTAQIIDEPEEDSDEDQEEPQAPRRGRPRKGIKK